MDRVLVFREHELSRELGRGELSREALVAAFFGDGGDHAPGNQDGADAASVAEGKGNRA
jgi:hypothetical protein